MTHSLHRFGTVADLEQDYCVLMQVSKPNTDGSGPKIRRFLELCKKHNAANLGIMEAGSILNIGYRRVLDTVADGTSVQAVFSEQQDVTNLLSDLVQEDLGLSIVVSGLVDRVEQSCSEVGLKPHTWNNSLGVWGKTDLLPSPDVRQITTMCGHGLISVSLIKEAVKEVRGGRKNVKEATEWVVGPCICGMANPIRIERLLTQMCGVE